jgi:hypothetical protein
VARKRTRSVPTLAINTFLMTTSYPFPFVERFSTDLMLATASDRLEDLPRRWLPLLSPPFIMK